MQIWYIKDGKKTGPLEIYEFRALIREDAVQPDTRVWHEGCEGWLPAENVDVLAGEFVLDEPPALPEEEAKPEREPFAPWRRLGARWFDTFLYYFIFCLGAWASTGDLPGFVLPENPWTLVLRALPWLLIEGALIHRWGTTPGKWLLGLQVKRLDGTFLTPGTSVMRALRVWILGMGMGLGLLAIIGHVVAYIMGRKRGAPLWDLASGFQVTTRRLSRQRIIVFVLLSLLLNALLTWLLWPVMQEVMASAKKS